MATKKSNKSLWVMLALIAAIIAVAGAGMFYAEWVSLR